MIFGLLAAAIAVAYGRDPEQVGDVFLPQEVTAETPVVLSIHGGGWTAMRRDDVRGICDYLVENGCAVYNIDYRLANARNPWPACGDDCLAAAKFVLAGGLRAQGLEPKRLWTIGGSAGGHLSLWTGLNLPAEQVAGVISISGIADPAPDAAAHPGRYRALFGGRASTAADFDSMSILKLVRKGGPKILLTHAREDTVVPEASARNFYLAYRQVGEISFSQYSCKDEPNTGGHCIWRKGVKNPRRLISRVEGAIGHFMGFRGMDDYAFSGEDFGWLFTGDGWQTAILTYGPIFSKLTSLERHLASAEMFALLAGEATLYLDEELRPVRMVRGHVYNVRRGTWHQIVVSPDARVLVVENTGDVQTEIRQL